MGCFAEQGESYLCSGLWLLLAFLPMVPLTRPKIKEDLGLCFKTAVIKKQKKRRGDILCLAPSCFWEHSGPSLKHITCSAVLAGLQMGRPALQV
jgi:hypothetical protein